MIFALLQLLAAVCGLRRTTRLKRPPLPGELTGRVWVPATRKRRGYWRRM